MRSLDHAARPADALTQMQREPLGREAGGKRDFEVGAVPAAAVQLQRGVRVLGHRLGGDAADLLQGGAAQHGAGAAEEGGVPVVVAVLDQAVEHVALRRHAGAGGEVPLERVGRVEMVRRLHQGDVGLLDQPAHRELQEGAGRDVVAVEDGDELAVGLRHRVVEVAGLGVLVVGAGDVAAADRLRELAELLALAVVEQPDAHLVGRPVDRHRRQHRGAHDRHRLVVGGYVDVDRGPGRRVLGQRHRLAPERPRRLRVAEHQHGHGVDFRPKQPHAEEQRERAAERQRLREAPEDVACRHRQRERHQEQRHLLAANPVGEEEHDHAADGEHSLLLRLQRHRRHRQHQRESEDCQQDVNQAVTKSRHSRGADRTRPGRFVGGPHAVTS